MRKLRVAVIGAGMGGLATAAALDRADVEAHVFEQAPKFTRLGAGIQIGCNAMKVMREFGLEDYLRRESFYPRSWNNKDYDTGEVRFDMIFGERAEWSRPSPTRSPTPSSSRATAGRNETQKRYSHDHFAETFCFAWGSRCKRRRNDPGKSESGAK
jgi:hypothetical protein